MAEILWKNYNNKVARFPGDFTLFEFEEYSRQTGQFVSYEVPINLGTALEYKTETDVIPTPSEIKE